MSHCTIRFQVPILWLQRTLYENFHDAGWSDINHLETSEKESTLYPTTKWCGTMNPLLWEFEYLRITKTDIGSLKVLYILFDK